MKYNEKQFAQGLHEALVNKKPNEIRLVLEKFIALLFTQNALAKTEKIIEHFSALWDRKNFLVRAVVASPRPLDRKIIDQLKSSVSEKTGAKTVEISHKIDGSLLGGAIIKYDDKVLDISLKSKLTELKSEMVK